MSTKRPTALIGIGRYTFSPGAGFGEHSHATHQLSWARTGLQRVVGGERRWTLPPTEAMWTPGGVVHDVQAVQHSDLVLLYFEAAPLAPAWRRATAVGASDALHALVDRLPGGPGETFFAEPIAVSLSTLVESVGSRGVRAPMPTDEPARQIAEHLCRHPGDDRTLVEWGREVGASSKTLARSFHKGTGMTFTDWRIQTRLHASLAYLADGLPVTRVAHEVGYSSASSFIVAFRRQFGHPPLHHFAVPVEQPA
jgi:AraC-like DNA-binding protein